MSRRFIPCFAIALVVGSTAASGAATLRVHRFAMPLSHAAAARRGLRPAFATPADIGSSNTVTADAPVTRPNETPCVVPLFTNATFAAYAPQTFSYVPPAHCPGPYQKIVFNGNFGVSAGIQFDRTASIEVGNVPLYYGTTAEPSPNLAPSWHVERDVTDEAALLATPQTVEADIFNIVDSTYTGIISGTTFLQFYPAPHAAAAATAATPDVVLAFPGVAGGPQILNNPTSVLSATYTLPTNVVRAYLDVYAQSQQTDEQYFNCAPSDVASELFACPNGPLRETEVAIDGKPAGVAPVTPWIFTGGLDPFLWFPIPGAQTLEFKPYRVDLTPFAGVLANGKPHTVSVSVDNADSYFQVLGTLLAYEDHGSKAVTGGVTVDTLVPDPPASTVENLSGTSPSVDGTITVSANRQYAIAGYVNSSKGRLTTTVLGSLAFANKQTYSNEGETTGTLTMQQTTTANVASTTVGPFGLVSESVSQVTLPITESLALVLDSTGTGTQVAQIRQQFQSVSGAFGLGQLPSGRFESNTVQSTDTLNILDDEFITGNSGQASSQAYSTFDSTGTCYAQTIQAANNVLTSVVTPRCLPVPFWRNLRGTGTR